MEDLVVVPGLVIPWSEIDMSTMKGSGPGGQSVNTTDSTVELRLNLASCPAFDDRQRARLLETLGSRLTAEGVLIVRASTERSQHRNRAEARARLVALLRGGLRPRTPRRPTRVSKRQRQRRMESKRARSDTKRLRRPPGSQG